MKKELIMQLTKTFEGSAYSKNGVEYWMARDLQILLEYAEWRNFCLVIDKAKIACAKSKQKITDHFVDVNKMIDVCKGGIGKSGIKPEELPPEEDIKKLKRRLSSEGKSISCSIKKLK